MIAFKIAPQLLTHSNALNPWVKLILLQLVVWVTMQFLNALAIQKVNIANCLL